MSTRLNFNALRDLHITANDQLHSPKIQQALLTQQKCVHQVSEASLTMLDVCDITKNVLLHVKSHLQDLQSTLRRVIIGKPRKSAKIATYRKKLKKETLKCLSSLKGIKSDIVVINPNLGLIVDVLKEVRGTTICIVESLLSLVSIAWLDEKSSKGLFGIRRLKVGQSLYDVCDEIEIQSANKRMEAVENAIEVLEVEIECISRRLIHTRVLLLNILTTN